jgi:hypothetical protein
MDDQELELARRNNRLGIILFLIAVIIFAATIAASYIYLALD